MNSCNQEKKVTQSFYRCHSQPASSDEETLSDLVKDYLEHYGDCYKIQAQWWGDKTLNWKSALERAWLSRFADGKMHSHQRRVSANLGEGLKIARTDDVQPDCFKTFEQLYDWVESVTNRIKGLADTSAYDVAQRLGMWLDLSPNVVYLHRGTAYGAKKFNIKRKTAPLNAFPPEIQQLGCAHAENFLCIYKDRIQAIVSSPG